MLCVSEAGIVLLGRAVFEEEPTTELDLDPEAEETSAESVEGRVEDVSVLEGLIDVAPDLV